MTKINTHLNKIGLRIFLNFIIKKSGTPLVHLDDLPNKVCVSFNEKGKQKIREKFNKFIEGKKKRSIMEIFGWGAAKVLDLSEAGARLNLKTLVNKGLIYYKKEKLYRGRYKPLGFLYKITDKGKNWMMKHELQNLGRSLSPPETLGNNRSEARYRANKGFCEGR